MSKRISIFFLTLLLAFSLPFNAFATTMPTSDKVLDNQASLDSLAEFESFQLSDGESYEIIEDEAEFERQMLEQGYELVFSEEIEVPSENANPNSRFIDFNIGLWSVSIKAYSDGAGLYRWTATPKLYQVGTSTLDYACADTTMISFNGANTTKSDPRYSLHTATTFYTVDLPYAGKECYISMALKTIEKGDTRNSVFTETYTAY